MTVPKLNRNCLDLLERVDSVFDSELRAECGLVAVSGGSDSMALLELLGELRRRGRLAGLVAAYVDHGLRVEAALEAAWVQAAARRLGVEFRQAPCGGGRDDEASLRERRYAALERMAQDCGARWIATAHTADDQIETMLLRLLRGAGRRGMSGIAPRRGPLLRPLLSTRRSELQALLLERGIGWCRDASNEQLRYARNRLRHLVLPAIEQAFGEDGLRQLPLQADYWRREEELLEAETRRHAAFAVRGAGKDATVDVTALRSIAPALATRVLRSWFEQVSGGRVLSLRQLEQIERLLAERDGSKELRVGGLMLVREYDRLSLIEPAGEVPNDFAIPVDLSQPCRLDGPDGAWSVSVEPRPRVAPRRAMSTLSEEIDLPAAALAGRLLLRAIRPGDVLRSGSRGDGRQIRDMMIDRKIPRRARLSWPVLAAEGASEVLWVPGVGLAAGLGGAPDGDCVRLAWRRRQR